MNLLNMARPKFKLLKLTTIVEKSHSQNHSVTIISICLLTKEDDVVLANIV